MLFSLIPIYSKYKKGTYAIGVTSLSLYLSRNVIGPFRPFTLSTFYMI